MLILLLGFALYSLRQCSGASIHACRLKTRKTAAYMKTPRSNCMLACLVASLPRDTPCSHQWSRGAPCMQHRCMSCIYCCRYDRSLTSKTPYQQFSSTKDLNTSSNCCSPLALTPEARDASRLRQAQVAAVLAQVGYDHIPYFRGPNQTVLKEPGETC